MRFASACRPEPPVGSERPKVRTIGGVSLGMKIYKNELFWAQWVRYRLNYAA